ncbi:hypothetical protein SeMB42_g02943 [Synchytrium endobioticum]|uniref:Uncharacterized protein n=1 Tax=Synchytrium endobioticum TaxID=286115 RepID=A0A507DAM8_9FUNG|nr:hypothetical protein SeMB42_g02943 [Synchytrium endobioticum]
MQASAPTEPSSELLSEIFTLFLQRRLDEATALLTPYILATSPPVWILYLRIAAERTIAQGGAAWQQCIQAFGGVGYIPADVLVPGIQLLLRQALHEHARDAFEAWLSLQDDAFFQSLLATPSGPEAVAYDRLVELYVLHVLPTLADWTCAHEFLADNDTVGAAKREVLMKHVRKLREVIMAALDAAVTSSHLDQTRGLAPSITTPSAPATNSSTRELDTTTIPISALKPPPGPNASNVGSNQTGLLLVLATREPFKSRFRALLSSGPGQFLVLVWNKICQTAKMGMNVQTF